VKENGQGYMLASPGKDGVLEAKLGGAFFSDEAEHDIVMIDDAFFQYPSSPVCDCSREEEAGLIAFMTKEASARWRSPEFAEFRRGWLELSTRQPSGASEN